MSLESYWSLADVAAEAQQSPFLGTDTDALNELERMLAQSVKGQQLSDVPLGAFLSGGIDSSLIVALMQSQSSRPVNTFTIGFKEDAYNEAKFASEVASHLGTNHNEMSFLHCLNYMMSHLLIHPNCQLFSSVNSQESM